MCNVFTDLTVLSFTVLTVTLSGHCVYGALEGVDDNYLNSFFAQWFSRLSHFSQERKANQASN